MESKPGPNTIHGSTATVIRHDPVYFSDQWFMAFGFTIA
jgi:hypothetical protein